MRKSVSAILAIVSLTLLILGCGSTNTNCPSIAGNWQITQHCQSSFVSQTVTISQNGCDLTAFSTWSGWTGKVEENGAIYMAGMAGDDPMSCTGMASGSTINASCNPTCDVTLTR